MLKNLISPKELVSLLRNKKQKIIFIDLRTETEHAFSRIPGTLNIPLEQIENHISYLKEYDKIILQCTHDSRSKFVLSELIPDLNNKILILKGGIAEWENQGYAIQYEKKVHISIARQLHLFSGIVLIIGLSLYKLTNNILFLLLLMIIAIGLTQSGLTNKCLMTRILIKMPWNS